MTQLTPDAVDNLVAACLYPPDELPADRSAPPDAIIVQGIISTFGFSTGLSDQLVRSAADLDAALVDVERCVAALATATSTLEARRLACLEASPIIDQERADLIAEETR